MNYTEMQIFKNKDVKIINVKESQVKIKKLKNQSINKIMLKSNFIKRKTKRNKNQ